MLSVVMPNVVVLNVVYAEYLRKAFYSKNHYTAVVLSVKAPKISYLILLYCA